MTTDEEKEATHGQKMIEVKVRFWTNDIAETGGNIIPKHAWAAGMVRMERNASHGIVPGNPEPFHSPFDLGAAIEKVLIDHGVVLHTPRVMKKYWQA